MENTRGFITSLIRKKVGLSGAIVELLFRLFLCIFYLLQKFIFYFLEAEECTKFIGGFWRSTRKTNEITIKKQNPLHKCNCIALDSGMYSSIFMFIDLFNTFL